MTKKTKALPETVITLTLPASTSLQRTGTLVIRRGEIARMKAISFSETIGLARAIREALSDIQALAANPPTVPPASDLREVQAGDPPPAIDGSNDAMTDDMAEPEDEIIGDEITAGDCDDTLPDPLFDPAEDDLPEAEAEFLPPDTPAGTAAPAQLSMFAF